MELVAPCGGFNRMGSCFAQGVLPGHPFYKRDFEWTSLNESESIDFWNSHSLDRGVE
jgi:hypothetical protein